ncbi:TRAP transporter large permease [Falsigemmobacter faecalis]|uniref:TRAP transporter large permease subunit n=1 Tax=Falsigemmobacter faecalis TaxID=2488730 RepID=A0A3P3DVB9_9RHOB|nr:TRAP transporter large permease subunit [Falsigemmobacter faecalis]RRH78190.1 TRAP transporter large permease subunit [Falsigemmobacter faecalis]
MDHSLIFTFVILWVTIFLLLGQAVATVMLGAGFVGLALWMGPNALMGIIGQDVYFSVSNYPLSIIPLYLLMAQMLVRGQIVGDLFRVGHRLAGYRRFPLGVATILTGGMLGAVSGSGSASAAALARLAGPELERVGYTRNFSAGLAAISGSLSAIIPPSILLMIYGSITLVPIGHLFIGSIGPAVLCILVYIVCLRFMGETIPGVPDRVAPLEEEDPDALRRSYIAIAFICVLMGVVFGGIYGGIFTVGEAGGLGAFTALTGVVLMRRVSFKDVAHGLMDAAKISAMLLMIIMAAQVFGRFMSISRVPRLLVEFTEPLQAYPVLLLIVLMVVLFLAGMALEEVTCIILIIPLIEPMLKAAGIDMIWFGVMACFVISLGLLTPPVGLVAFSAAVAANVTPGAVFRPALKFASVAALIVVLAMIFIPGIVTWLPAQLN